MLLHAMEHLLTSAQHVVQTLHVTGPHPEFHLRAVQLLRDEWPSLWLALLKLQEDVETAQVDLEILGPSGDPIPRQPG